MTTRSNTPASPPHPGLQPGLKNAEYMKRWDKSGSAKNAIKTALTTINYASYYQLGMNII
jgi:hypothetical protein